MIHKLNGWATSSTRATLDTGFDGISMLGVQKVVYLFAKSKFICHIAFSNGFLDLCLMSRSLGVCSRQLTRIDRVGYDEILKSTNL
jgi:hypothetical protein